MVLAGLSTALLSQWRAFVREEIEWLLRDISSANFWLHSWRRSADWLLLRVQIASSKDTEVALWLMQNKLNGNSPRMSCDGSDVRRLHRKHTCCLITHGKQVYEVAFGTA